MNEKNLNTNENPFLKLGKIWNNFFGSYISDENREKSDNEEFLLDKVKYISDYNRRYFTNSADNDQNKYKFYYLSNIHFLRHLGGSFLIYYGLLSIYCNLKCNLKTFPSRIVNQNHYFKKTFYIPIIFCYFIHNYYFSLDFLFKEYATEMKIAENLNIDNLFLDKQKIYLRLAQTKKDVLDGISGNENETKKLTEDENNLDQEIKLNNRVNDSEKNISEIINKENLLCLETEKHFILKFVSELEKKGIL